MSRERKLRGASALLALGLAACGSASESPPPSAAPAGNDNGGTSELAPPSTSAPTHTDEVATSFEVHEWGLVDVPLAGPTEIGAGPGQPSAPPMSVRKPVIYVHAEPGAAPFTIDVSARFPNGELLEVWPSASEWPSTHVDASSILWRGVTVNGCEGASPRGPLTAREATVCASPDGYCEVGDLPTYVTSDASCLVANGASASLLFYRGRTSTAAVPLQIVSATSVVAHTLGGSPILHVREGRGSETPWPAPGAAAPLASPDAMDGAALASRLQRILIDAGLTSPEADAFLRAWSEPLFDVAWGGAARDLPERSLRRAPGRGVAAPVVRHHVIYVMPESTVAALAELTISPAPRAIRRVMVVRVELAP